MTYDEFNELYEIKYTKTETLPMNLMTGKDRGYWFNYTKSESFEQVVVTKKDDPNYWDTYRGDMKSIVNQIIRFYQLEQNKG